MKTAVFLDLECLAGWLASPAAVDRFKSIAGSACVRRAYGNFSNPAVSARQAALSRLGFELVHVYHPVKGKNSADIQLIVDAMEYVARVPDVLRVVLATGDSDFSPLFRRLRELGKEVVGVGPHSALSEAVLSSCSRFIYTDEVEGGAAARPGRGAAERRAVKLAERALARLPANSELGRLKVEMLALDKTFSERAFGYRRFLDFALAIDDVVALRRDERREWHIGPPQPAGAAPEPASSSRQRRTSRGNRLQLVFDAFQEKAVTR